MAAEQIDLAAEIQAEADQRAEILGKVNRLLATVQRATAELVELIPALEDKQRRTVADKDEYGEPTWAYKVKCKVPPKMYVTRKFLEYGAEFGFNVESMSILMNGRGTYEGFIKYYQRTGKKWSNWSLVFQKWVRTEHERKQKAQQQGGGGATRFGQLRTRS